METEPKPPGVKPPSHEQLRLRILSPYRGHHATANFGRDTVSHCDAWFRKVRTQ